MRGADGKARDTRLCLRGGGVGEEEEEEEEGVGKGALKEKAEVMRFSSKAVIVDNEIVEDKDTL